jgi:hypothetical protein
MRFGSCVRVILRHRRKKRSTCGAWTHSPRAIHHRTGDAVNLLSLQGWNKAPDREVVELRGFEPLTFSLRTRRATNCATAPSEGQR